MYFYKLNVQNYREFVCDKIQVLIVKVNAQAKKKECAFSLTKAPGAFSLTNDEEIIYRFVIHLTISFLRAILPNLREAESSSVEAQLEEEYLR